jgi:hypothetical protein
MIQLITALLPTLSKVLDKAIPDKDMAKKIEADLQKELITNSHSEFQSAAKIVLAEAQGSWIKGNWRPITMLTFVGLICAHWLGFTPENLSEAEVLELMNLVQIGLGGYIIGRSAEKVSENIKIK